MKKVIGALLFVLVTSVSFSQKELKWYTDMNEAVKVAQQDKKPLMLFFTGSDWCGWCHKLQREVFTQQAFIDWAAKSVVLVEVDFPRAKVQPQNIKDQNNLLQRQFGVQGYPTVWFVKAENTSDGKINLSQYGSSGYRAGGPENWINEVKAFLPAK